MRPRLLAPTLFLLPQLSQRRCNSFNTQLHHMVYDVTCWGNSTTQQHNIAAPWSLTHCVLAIDQIFEIMMMMYSKLISLLYSND